MHSFTTVVLTPGVAEMFANGTVTDARSAAETILDVVPEQIELVSNTPLCTGLGMSGDQIAWKIDAGDWAAEETLFALGLRSDMLEELGFKLRQLDAEQSNWILELKEDELVSLLEAVARQHRVRSKYTDAFLESIADAVFAMIVKRNVDTIRSAA